MRIVNRQEFLAMPAGTVFYKYEPCVFEDLQIKAESIGDIDFFYQEITSAIECNDSGEFFDLLNKAKEDGISLPMDFYCGSRDGLFDQDQLFAVFEPDDVRGLIERLETALKDSGSSNDE